MQPFTEREGLLCTPLLQHSILLYKIVPCITFIYWIIKVTFFLSSYMSWIPFCIENQTNRSGNSYLARNAIINWSARFYIIFMLLIIYYLYKRVSCITFICLNINKSDTFSFLLICPDFLFVLKIRQIEVVTLDLLEMWYLT